MCKGIEIKTKTESIICHKGDIVEITTKSVNEKKREFFHIFGTIVAVNDIKNYRGLKSILVQVSSDNGVIHYDRQHYGIKIINSNTVEIRLYNINKIKKIGVLPDIRFSRISKELREYIEINNRERISKREIGKQKLLAEFGSQY